MSKEGKKQRKFGRNSRCASGANQKYRSLANKHRNIKKASNEQKQMVVIRGTARHERRASVNWDKVFADRQNHGAENVRWQKYEGTA